MEWLQPYINEAVQNIEETSTELWDFFIESSDSDLSNFKQNRNSFGKSALYANIALGLSYPEISDALSNNMGASSPKTPTGKEEMLQAEGIFKEMGMALDVADRITAEWDLSAKAAGGYDQGKTRTYQNVKRLIDVVKRGPTKVPRPAPQPQQSLLAPGE